jgi:biotin-(acetyl-CoA carboxylase) ligase
MRKIYYTGSNEKAAMLSGINVVKVKFGVYIISALLAGIAGVLAENCYVGERLLFCVIGIGVNVLHKKNDFDGLEYKKPPTSLLIEGQKKSVDEVLIKLLQAIDMLYAKALHSGTGEVVTEVAKYRSFV